MKVYDVLIVEDDEALCEALCDTLELEGFQIIFANNGTEALVKLAKNKIKLVVSDVQMPVMDGIQLLNQIQREYSEVPVLLMTAYGTVPKAVEAIHAGAADYLVKPFDASELVLKVTYLLANKVVDSSKQIIADDAMQRLYGLANKVAQTDVSVLIQGASGSGKEVLAQFIHQNSPFKEGPFVAINCAAIPETMLESLLFGYEKGAFTGATQAVAGKFEMAQGGTLLLDEISEMDINLQAKLLRVIQEKEVERLGSQRKIKLKVRILATTNRQLKEYVQEGAFREDLYYRLNVFPLLIPALKDRKADILPLANELLKKYTATGNNIPLLTQEAEQCLIGYHWPGNVRELENIIQRALILQVTNTISEEQLVFEGTEIISQNKISPEKPIAVEVQAEEEANDPVPSLGRGLRSAEEKIILSTLMELNGSRKLTAEKLGISPRTLRYKIARMKDEGVVIPC